LPGIRIQIQKYSVEQDYADIVGLAERRYPDLIALFIALLHPALHPALHPVTDPVSVADQEFGGEAILHFQPLSPCHSDSIEWNLVKTAKVRFSLRQRCFVC
jgi:hypothetical protein